MKKLITLFAIAGLVLALAPAAQAQVTLSDGHTGDYRIIFVTLAAHGAKDQTITPYNTFVNAQGNDVLSTQTEPLNTSWTVVGSTKNTSAKVNTSTTGTGADIHLYTPTTTDGYYQRVAISYDDLWDGNIETAIQFGDGSVMGSNYGYDQWTGTESNGDTRPTGADGSYLGSGTGGDGTAAQGRLITLARGNYTDAGWIEGPSDHDGDSPTFTKEMRFIGMSAVLSTEPIPPSGTVIMFK
jgi:hypothetical protein